jgi:hypothetical protein
MNSSTIFLLTSVSVIVPTFGNDRAELDPRNPGVARHSPGAQIDVPEEALDVKRLRRSRRPISSRTRGKPARPA